MNRNKTVLTFELNPNKLDERILQGQPIVYNEYSKINTDSAGEWVTRIAPFAFTDSLQEEIFAYLEHDPDKLLASTGNGSLMINESAQGVFVQLRLPKTTLGEDVYQMVEEGLIKSMSFGVVVTDYEWTRETVQGREMDVRTIKAGEVFEVTITHRPAFAQTSINAFNEDQSREDYLSQKEEEKNQEIRKHNELYRQKIKLIEYEKISK